MVSKLQEYVKTGCEFIDKQSDYLGKAGKRAAPIGTLGGFCGFAVSVILGGHVVATTVGCATIVFAAMAINELVNRTFPNNDRFKVLGQKFNKQLVIKSAMFVTFAVLNHSHFKSMVGLSVATTLAVYLAYQKIREIVEKNGGKEGFGVENWDFEKNIEKDNKVDDNEVEDIDDIDDDFDKVEEKEDLKSKFGDDE